VLKLTLSLMLAICLIACASGPSTKSSSKAKPTYIGERNEAGEPHGRGVMTWSEYTKYDGEFENGLYHGQGTFYDIKIRDMGYGTYTGAWLVGKPDGHGTYKNVRHTYTGAWKDGLRHGTGSYTGSNWLKSYVGEWHKNTPTGEGRGVLPNGDIREGYFANGSLQGKGRLIKANRDVITGTFNGGRCGRENSLPLDHPYSNVSPVQCKLVKSNGDVVEGSFYGNQPDGFAIYRFANGDVYEGNFIAGKPNGEGTLTYANGDVISGLWKNGISQAKIEAEKRAKETKRQQAVEAELAKRVEDRLTACDSFGFERGTDSHAECAMQLYINEQNQATASQVTEQQRDEQQAVLDQQQREQKALLASQRQQLARQEAIQEAILKEQDRVRRMEQSMKLIELGTGIATGSLGGRSTPKMQSHTYTINGQIINCTTTGSSTDCR